MADDLVAEISKTLETETAARTVPSLVVKASANAQRS
jgi:hypothetical protein